MLRFPAFPLARRIALSLSIIPFTIRKAATRVSCRVIARLVCSASSTTATASGPATAAALTSILKKQA